MCFRTKKHIFVQNYKKKIKQHDMRYLYKYTLVASILVFSLFCLVAKLKITSAIPPPTTTRQTALTSNHDEKGESDFYNVSLHFLTQKFSTKNYEVWKLKKEI